MCPSLRSQATRVVVSCSSLPGIRLSGLRRARHRCVLRRRGWGGEAIHGPGEAGCPILSQSEDQSRPHPVLTFVHPMSTQVRGLGSNAAASACRSDPQIATRTRIRASRQAADYLKSCIKLLGFVPGELDRHLHHPDPCQETPRTPFRCCFNGLVVIALVG